MRSGCCSVILFESCRLCIPTAAARNPLSEDLVLG